MENAHADNPAMVGRQRDARRKPTEARPALFVGQWIRALGERPVDVVRGTGINEGYISELINGGKSNPSAVKMLQIADYLGIPLHYLYQPPPDRQFIEQVASLDPAIIARLRKS